MVKMLYFLLIAIFLNETHAKLASNLETLLQDFCNQIEILPLIRCLEVIEENSLEQLISQSMTPEALNLIELTNLKHELRRLESKKSSGSIVGPGTLSTACSTKASYSFLHSQPFPFNLTWEISLSPTNISISSQNRSITLLPSDYKASTSLTLSLNPSTSLIVPIISTPAPIFYFSKGRIQTQSHTSSLIIEAIILDMCGLGPTEIWTWRIDDQIIYNPSPNIRVLVLDPRMYKMNMSVQVSASLVSGGVETSERIQVEFVEAELIIVLNRVGGFVSINEDFQITAKGSYDPDGLVISRVNWECRVNNEVVFQQNMTELVLPKKFLNGNIVNITVHVWTETKNAWKSIQIQGSGGIAYAVFTNSSSAMTDKIYQVLDIHGSENYSFAWAQTSGSSLPLPSPELPLLRIPSSYLIGGTYSFSVSITSPRSYPNRLSFSYTTPSSPICSSLPLTSSQSIIFLKDPISVSLSSCYSLDPSFLPFTFSFITSIDSLFLQLSVPSYSSTLSSYLLPQSSNYFIQVCDLNILCTNFSFNTSVLTQNYYINNIESVYDLQGVGFIYPLCRNFQLSSAVVEKMRSDLNKLMKRSWDLSTNAGVLLSGISGLMMQVKYLEKSTEEALEILEVVIGKVNIDKGLMSLCVDIAGRIIERNLGVQMFNRSHAVIKQCLDKYTSDFIPGDEYFYDNDLIYILKASGSPKTLKLVSETASSTTRTLKNRTIEFPNLNFLPSQLLALEIILYQNLGNYSDLLSLTLSTIGSTSNNIYHITPPQELLLKALNPPILITLSLQTPSLNEYNCAFLSNNSWFPTGCKILSSSNGLIKFSTNHTSIFTIVDLKDLNSLPPPVYLPNIYTCGSSYNPIWILISFSFFFVIISPLINWWDTLKPAQKFTEIPRQNFSRDFSSEVSSDFSERSNPVSVSGDYEIANSKLVKGRWHLLVEGHLTFGIFYRRENYSRLQRLFSLYTVFVVELLVIGGVLYGTEDTMKGKVLNSRYFQNYKSEYFGYTIVAVIAGLSIELCLVILYGFYGRMRLFGVWTAGMIILLAAGGSIVGTVYLSVKMCRDWTVYWSISFIWAAVIEIALTQTCLMLIRFIALCRGTEYLE